MSVLIKILEPCVDGFVLRDQFTLPDDDPPLLLDVPTVFRPIIMPDGSEETGHLRRYKFRLRLEDTLYYTPVGLEAVGGGEA